MSSDEQLQKKKTEDQRQYLDILIGRYFRSLGKKYKDGGKGAFYQYCEDNGFEKNDVADELKEDANPEDFMFMEFFDPPEDEEDNDYPEFPLKPPIKDKTARNKEILRILIYLYKEMKIPSNNTNDDDQKQSTSSSTGQRRKSSSTKRVSEHYQTPQNILDIVIDIDKQTQKKCHRLYLEQCPLLYKEEDVLKRCFSISIKNNRYPFLINLVDSFLRDKALYQRAHQKKNKDLQMVKWRTTSKYFQSISKEQKKMADTLASGVDTYLRRGCTSWDYGPAKLARIQDSIFEISHYILMMSNFVQSLLKKHHTTPFQIDFPIAINKVKTMKLGGMDDELSDDSDIDGDDDEDEDEQKVTDQIGDIEEKLTKNKLPFYTFEINGNIKDTATVNRNIDTGFSKFKERLSKISGGYPHKKRLCMFIDRRHKKGTKDRLTIYEPPKNCNSMPNDMVPEWGFNAIKTCIIPAVADHGGMDNNKHAIRADSGVGGQLITISFQVEANDIIKVYMFWMGRYTRVYPQDFGLILSEIFDMNSCKNNKFGEKQQNEIYSKIKIMDTDFEQFYHQATYKKHVEFPKPF